MGKLKVLFSAIMAGICISIGGTAFLSVDNKLIGSILFTVGLFVIVTRKYSLFTGKVCYMLDNNVSYAIDVLLVFVGNLVGVLAYVECLKLTRIYEALSAKAIYLCSIKMEDNIPSLFFLGVLCNIMIFIAVDGFKNNPHEVGKYLSLFLGVPIFIICGFEHCVANMFYYAVAGIHNNLMWGSQFMVVLGNLVGGLIFPAVQKLLDSTDKTPDN